MSAPVTPSIASSVAAKVAANVPKGVHIVPMDDGGFPDYFHGMLYGDTGTYRTTTSAAFGGPEKTLIITPRSPEQVRIPLRGQGFRNPIVVSTPDALVWALDNPERAADAAGFPEWKDLPDRVLVMDDFTEAAAMLVDDNSTRDDGTDIKDGRQIYGATKKEVREIVNKLISAVPAKRMHIIFNALAVETEDAIFPDMPSGARKHLGAAFDYVFYMRGKKMVTERELVNYVAKDEKTGKPVTRSRQLFCKNKIPKILVGKTPPLLLREEPNDLRAVWEKISAAARTVGK
jgi:hypothetical protein